jgi:hypothetical protein
MAKLDFRFKDMATGNEIIMSSTASARKKNYIGLQIKSEDLECHR